MEMVNLEYFHAMVKVEIKYGITKIPVSACNVFILNHNKVLLAATVKVSRVLRARANYHFVRRMDKQFNDLHVRRKPVLGIHLTCSPH